MLRILTAALVLLLGACGSIKGENYLNAGYDFNLLEYFDGEITAYGIVQDRSGNVVQRFEVEIIGTRDGNTITLDETFSYSIGDGFKKRLWTITDKGTLGYAGSANDMLNTASGRDFGNAFYWTYKMDLPVGNTSYEVTFKDWMWAFDDKRIINRTYIKKFGITFAEVTMFMDKKS